MREDWYVVPARYALHMRTDPVPGSTSPGWETVDEDAVLMRLEEKTTCSTPPHRELPRRAVGAAVATVRGLSRKSSD